MTNSKGAEFTPLNDKGDWRRHSDTISIQRNELISHSDSRKTLLLCSLVSFIGAISVLVASSYVYIQDVDCDSKICGISMLGMALSVYGLGIVAICVYIGLSEKSVLLRSWWKSWLMRAVYITTMMSMVGFTVLTFIMFFFWDDWHLKNEEDSSVFVETQVRYSLAGAMSLNIVTQTSMLTGIIRYNFSGDSKVAARSALLTTNLVLCFLGSALFLLSRHHFDLPWTRLFAVVTGAYVVIVGVSGLFVVLITFSSLGDIYLASTSIPLGYLIEYVVALIMLISFLLVSCWHVDAQPHLFGAYIGLSGLSLVTIWFTHKGYAQLINPKLPSALEVEEVDLKNVDPKKRKEWEANISLSDGTEHIGAWGGESAFAMMQLYVDAARENRLHHSNAVVLRVFRNTEQADDDGTVAFVLLFRVLRFDLTSYLSGWFGRFLSYTIGANGLVPLLYIRLALVGFQWPFRSGIFLAHKRADHEGYVPTPVVHEWRDFPEPKANSAPKLSQKQKKKLAKAAAENSNPETSTPENEKVSDAKPDEDGSIDKIANLLKDDAAPTLKSNVGFARAGVEEEQTQVLLGRIMRATSEFNYKEAAGLRCSVLMLPSMETTLESRTYNQAGYFGVGVGPTMICDLRPFKGKPYSHFTHTLKKGNRRNHEKYFEDKGGKIYVEEDFQAYSPNYGHEMFAAWSNIADSRRAKGEVPTLIKPTPSFFNSINTQLDKTFRSALIMALPESASHQIRNKPTRTESNYELSVDREEEVDVEQQEANGKKIAGSAVLFQFPESGLLTSDIQGLDYSISRDTRAYFGVLQRTIRFAHAKGYRFVDFGPTTMEPKVDAGCKLVHCLTGYHTRSIVMRTLLKQGTQNFACEQSTGNTLTAFDFDEQCFQARWGFHRR